MERKKNHYVMISVCLFLVLACPIISVGTKTSSAFILGKTYDSSNWQKIEDNVPSFLVSWVKRGDFILKKGGLNFDLGLEKNFLVASQKNLGKLDINENGFIVD